MTERDLEQEARAAVFSGPGEMRALGRSFDWESTPIGPVAGWPQSLRTAVSLVLASGFPTAVHVFSELTLIYNDAWAALSAARHPDAFGRSSIISFPETRSIFEAHLRRAFQGETTLQPDQYFPFERDGVLQDSWSSVSYSPVYDEEQQVIAAFVTVVDTTSGRLVQQQLRDEEARYQLLFKNMEEGLVVCEMVRDADGRAIDFTWVELNPAVGRIANLKPQDLLGRRVSEVFPNIEWWVKTCSHVVETGESTRVEQYAESLDRWLDCAVTPYGGDRFAILYHDITARKQSEEALRKSEERQAFLLKLSDAMRPLDDPGEIQRVASRVLRLQLGAERVVYSEAVSEDELPITAYDAAEGAGPGLLTYHLANYGPDLVAEFCAGGIISRTDTANDPRMGERSRDRLNSTDVRAWAVAPLVKNGKLVAALGVHHRSVHAWTTDELSLLDEVAQRTWASVERARAETKLQETQRRLEDALSTARMAYWDWDPEADHTVGSPSMNDVFGLRAGETLDFTSFRYTLVHPDDRERHQVLIRHANTREEGWHAEFRIVRPRDGEIAWLEERATVTHDPDSGAAHTTALVWDVTDRKRAEATAERERLAKDRDTLRRQLAGAEEDERRRLARELHDQLGQELTAFQLGLVDATRLAGTHDGSRAESNAPLFRTLERLRMLADRMVAGARYVALELRPPELDDVGLESAIETYVHEWSGRYGISADVATMGLAEEDPMPTELASALYRIVQEALTNVAKHAGATQVSVIVERPEGEVRLIVEDDGRGFDLDETAVRVRNERRLGLAGIRERVALVGGSVSVESSPGKGTALFVRLPVGGGILAAR